MLGVCLERARYHTCTVDRAFNTSAHVDKPPKTAHFDRYAALIKDTPSRVSIPRPPPPSSLLLSGAFQVRHTKEIERKGRLSNSTSVIRESSLTTMYRRQDHHPPEKKEALVVAAGALNRSAKACPSERLCRQTCTPLHLLFRALTLCHPPPPPLRIPRSGTPVPPRTSHKKERESCPAIYSRRTPPLSESLVRRFAAPITSILSAAAHA